MSQCYRQLRLHEREALFRMKAARLPVREIAAELGRHPSTIYRELRRNYFFDDDAYFRGYFPSVAHKLARDRRLPGRKLERNPELANYVIDRLRSYWSPEQIAGRLESRRACPSGVVPNLIARSRKLLSILQVCTGWRRKWPNRMRPKLA